MSWTMAWSSSARPRGSAALQERKVLLARDDSPKTMPLLTKLDEPIALSFPAETPLNDVLRYIKTATATQDSLGIPIYVDPAGLREVDRATSPVHINLEGVPLRTSLRLIVEQLRLSYYVRHGNVIISSPTLVQRFEETTERERKSKEDQGQQDPGS